MNHRVPVLMLLVVMASLSSITVTGQHASASKATWTPLRTSDGQPDLQGYWTNDAYTPVERAPELGEKEFFTAAEAAAYFKKRQDQLHGQAKDNIHYDDAIWQGENYFKQADLRTSIINDPRDGRLPPLTPAAQQRAAMRAEVRRTRPSDSAASRSLAERCISWGNVGPPMVPPTYNANLQILQTRDYVVIRHEMMHDVRIIPLDGRPRLGKTIQQLAGDSRGRWEGETLVVDTTNFTEHTNFRGSPQTTRQDIFASNTLHVIERFTRLDEDTIRYQFTVEDPSTWTRPWSGEATIRRVEGPIFEYACHEGNYGLPNILSAARVEEQR
ncbi:MAG TPA: hypothetical protein VH701_27550 [Vicinamibacterales bacterium]|jgi:hypothetical protein